MNWFDSFISFFSPTAGVRRQRSRIIAQHLRKYEAAAKTRRTAGWVAAGTSQNAEVEGSLETMRNRSRQLVRDNGYASRGLEVINSNVIGRGILSQIKVESPQVNRRQNELNAKREKEINKVWRAWSRTTAIDYEGRLNLGQMQSVIMDAITESGEVLIRLRRTPRRFVDTHEGLVEVPPIALQILESDFLDLNGVLTASDRGNYVLQGIEFNNEARRVAYHLYEQHPGNVNIGSGARLSSAFRTLRVDAESVIHAYRVERPGQIRGVPWLHPVMLKLKDFDEYEDAQLVKQKVSTMWAAFVRDLEGQDILDSQDQGELPEQLEPGLIEILPNGKDITFASPPPTDGYDTYTKTLLHGVAAGLGITYEALVGDLSMVNFSSARMGWLEMNRNIDAWRKDIMIDQVLTPIWDWFRNSCGLIGLDTSRARIQWSAPRREMIDPAKEINAMKTAVRSGFLSLSEAVRNQGLDPDMHFEEVASDFEMLKQRGIVLESDPSQDSGRSNQIISDLSETTD